MNRFMSLGCVLVLLLVSGCGNMIQGKSIAEAQIVVFHQQFNDSDFEAIIASSHSSLFKETSKETFTDILTAMQRKLGKQTASSSVQWNVNTMNGITTVVLAQDTTFEEGKGTETFTFRISNEKAMLVGYNINSLDLIIK